MYKLVVEDKEYNLPEDMTLETWTALSNWNPVAANYPQIISIAMGMPLKVVDTIPDDTKELAVALILALTSPDWKNIKPEYNGGKLINLDKITLGQFVDLEVAISNSLYKNIKQVVSVLYGTEVKPNTKLGDVWGAVTYYMNWRILLYKQYKGLFNIDIDNEEVIENTPSKNVNSAHVWYDIVMTLADNKFLNIEPTVNRPLVEALNWLAWNKDRIRKEQEELNKIR